MESGREMFLPSQSPGITTSTPNLLPPLSEGAWGQSGVHPGSHQWDCNLAQGYP